MRIRQILATTALAAGLTIAGPAMAQDANGPGNDSAADDNSVDDGNNNSQVDDGGTIVRDTANDFLDLLSNNGNGHNRDNESMHAVNGSNAADDGSSIQNGSNVVAAQTLIAINANSQLDEVVDMDGEDGTPSPVGYHSGNNVVGGNAFAAYAGILNQAWNTGINSNAQAATNIAAQGTVNFGTGGAGGADAGGGGGD